MANANRLYRVRPTANQYEDPQLMYQGSGKPVMMPREAFYAPPPNQPPPPQPFASAAGSNSNRQQRSTHDFDRDFRNELQSFNDAVTQFVGSHNAKDNGGERYQHQRQNSVQSENDRLSRHQLQRKKHYLEEQCVDDDNDGNDDRYSFNCKADSEDCSGGEEAAEDSYSEKSNN